MNRAVCWAIRVTFATGQHAFLRRGGVFGQGPIMSFTTKDRAERDAEDLRNKLDVQSVVTVIERSHGRMDRTPADG